jgi:hypothetical protein
MPGTVCTISFMTSMLDFFVFPDSPFLRILPLADSEETLAFKGVLATLVRGHFL